MLFLGWIISDQGEIIQKSRINSNPSMPIDTKLKKNMNAVNAPHCNVWGDSVTIASLVSDKMCNDESVS